jgi:AsmA protein
MVDKRWFLIGVLVLAVLLFVVLLVPFIVNADSFRPTIESQLSGALGREVTMGKLSFSLMQASLIAEDIAIADDPGFSDVPFVQARSLAVGIQLLPYFYNRQVRITKLTIDTPSMQLIKHADGKWNYSSLGRSSNRAESSEASAPDLSIGELSITNGSALLSSVPATAKPFEYSEVNLQVKKLSLLTSSPFELSAKLPGGGTVKLTGNAGPISQKDTSQTPFEGDLQLREFNPVTAGLIEASKGISMENDVDGKIKSDGTNVTSSGKITASRLQLAAKGSPAQEPVNIDYSISENLATRSGSVSDVAIHTGSAAVHVNGSFKFSPEGIMLDLRLSAPALPMEEVERLLPVVGIDLPSGSSLQGGTLTADIGIGGPAISAIVAGPVEIDNTTLAGFDLGSNIEGLKLPGVTDRGTGIRVLRAAVNSSSAGTRLTDIYGELPQVGTATGNGALTPSGELDFHLIAKLNGANAAGSIVNAKPVKIASRTIPLTIKGTANSPSIQASVSAVTR